ncbi:MAG: hypothetical protein E7330_00505 [Clostridiales bacterium]|nr:hypothetical protein [Clostridiales bacterium]
MNIEQRWEEHCPVAGKAVLLRELTASGCGGSCQVDTQTLERSCELQMNCPRGAGCLLFDLDNYA